jgi:hypothetical protein
VVSVVVTGLVAWATLKAARPSEAVGCAVRAAAELAMVVAATVVVMAAAAEAAAVTVVAAAGSEEDWRRSTLAN